MTWMVKGLAVFFGLLMLAGCGVVRVSQSASQVRAVNLGFEEGAAGPGMPSAWSYGNSSPTSYEWASDDAVKRSGQRSLRIRAIGDAPAGFGGVTQCIRTPKNASVVRYSGYLKTEKASAAVGEGAGLWIRIANEEDTDDIAFDNMHSRHEPGTPETMEDRRLHGDTDWTRQEIELKIPKERGRTCFGALMDGPGTFWADDLKIEFSSS